MSWSFKLPLYFQKAITFFRPNFSMFYWIAGQCVNMTFCFQEMAARSGLTLGGGPSSIHFFRTLESWRCKINGFELFLCHSSQKHSLIFFLQNKLFIQYLNEHCNSGSWILVGNQRSMQNFPVKIKLHIPALFSPIPPSSQDICTQHINSFKQAYKDNEITTRGNR